MTSMERSDVGRPGRTIRSVGCVFCSATTSCMPARLRTTRSCCPSAFPHATSNELPQRSVASATLVDRLIIPRSSSDVWREVHRYSLGARIRVRSWPMEALLGEVQGMAREWWKRADADIAEVLGGCGRLRGVVRYTRAPEP